MLPIKLDDLIDVAVRLAPDLARAKVDRSIAKDAAEGARRDQAWVATSHAEYARSAVADHVEVPPFSVVAEDQVVGRRRAREEPADRRPDPGRGRPPAHEHRVQRLRSRCSVRAARRRRRRARTRTASRTSSCRKTRRSSRRHSSSRLSRGFGPAVALANEQKADLASTEATIKAQLAAEEMVRDIVVAYWELAYSSFEVDVRTQARRPRAEAGPATHEQIRAGSVASTALGSVTYEIATRQEALLRSQLDLEQKSLDLRQQGGPRDRQARHRAAPRRAVRRSARTSSTSRRSSSARSRRTASSRPSSSRRRSRTSTSTSRRTRSSRSSTCSSRARCSATATPRARIGGSDRRQFPGHRRLVDVVRAVGRGAANRDAAESRSTASTSTAPTSSARSRSRSSPR